MSAFVSHDGDGTEVHVTTVRGKVTDIEERTTSANVKIEAPYLKYPVGGWLNINEEALTILRNAKENGEEVEARVEAQRKPKIDKSIPIQEIKDSKSANTDIIKKLVCVNGVFTSEALTNPEDDPDTGKAKSALGRTSAPKQDGGSTAPTANKGTVLGLLNNLATSRDVAESVLDALKAQALLSGATVQEVLDASTVEGQAPPVQQAGGFSREAPAFKEYNSDGRLNLGGASVAAGVGVFNYVFEKLAKTLESDPNNETVEYLTALVLSMADLIQTYAYGKGANGQSFNVDRTAGSHTRARATLFTVIDINPFPVTATGEVASADVVNAWVKKVGTVARQNFTTGITLSQQFPSVKNLLDFVANGGGIKETAPEATESVSKPVETPAAVVAPETFSKPVEEQPAASEPVSEPTVEEIVKEPTPEVPETVEITVDEIKDETSTPDDGLIRFEQRLLPPGAINSSNAPSEDILAQFKEFVIEETGLKTKAEQAQVGRLLAATFGRAYNKASNIPEDDLADFLDFYVSTGVENFKGVLASV